MFPSWITSPHKSFQGLDAMKDFLDKPQVKQLAETIDYILSGQDLKEQD